MGKGGILVNLARPLGIDAVDENHGADGGEGEDRQAPRGVKAHRQTAFK